MKYEARLFAHEWINGTGWVSVEDEVESWDVKPEDVETWKQLIKSNDKSLFDYVVDTAEALSDGEEGDCQWTIKLVEIDEDDVFETGELIAETSIWESELNPNKRMKIAKIYTWYDFMDGHRFAPCCVRHFDKDHFDHSCEQDLGLIITIPEGYRLSENENGDPLLVPENGGENIMLTYDVDRNCIMDYSLHAPIKDVSIVEKVSYYD